MVADISCKMSVFCTEITAQKGHYLENWTVSFSMTGGHFSSLGLGLECLGELDKHQQRIRIYWAQINQNILSKMQQRLVLSEYSKVWRCGSVSSFISLYSFTISVEIRSRI